jgi:putative transposase
MQKWRQSETADGEEWQLALEREAVIRPLASKSKLSVTLIEEATRQLRLSRTVFYDLLRRYKQRPQTSSLLPWKRGREFKVTGQASRRAAELLHSGILFEDGTAIPRRSRP